ncbi:MAG: hypothetical protein OEY14_08925, partial [Myxococcales bacterium]|nr:hypothetical protein [Myxococcales bacterium]
MTRAIAWLSIAAVIGCGGGETPAAEYPPIQEEGEARPEGTEPTGEGSAAEAGPAEEPAAEAAAPIRVVAAERTGVLGTPPTLRIRMPPNGRLVRSGDVQLTLRLDDWELQPAPGAHLHLVIDNEPYIAIRDISRNLNVNALAREHLGHELAEGSHVLRLFLSRTNHESIKTEGSAATLLVHFRSRTPDFGFDADAPMLTYSRPKGCYESGSRVMLD